MSRQKTFWGWLLGALGVVIFLAAVAAATWRIFIYPWAQSWGATRLEQAMLLPGNEFVPSATSQSTYAIDIQAPPERAWMWLVQIGQDRSGFYSYSFLENLVGDPIQNVIEIRPGVAGAQGRRLCPSSAVGLSGREAPGEDGIGSSVGRPAPSPCSKELGGFYPSPQGRRPKHPVPHPLANGREFRDPPDLVHRL